MTNARRLTAASAALTLALALAGCAPAVDSIAPGGTTPDASAETPGNPNENEPGDEPDAPAQQAASCEWDAPKLPEQTPVAPEGTAGDLATVLVGSWQFTHYDEGNGFEPMDDTDIRYVFPSADHLIYCQHVPGATEHAENEADITIEGTTIFPPSPHKGFGVLAWSADTMLWQNNYDDSTFLLVRR